MRSGLRNRVVGQSGEFAVCSQLGKLGLIATPFAGNVPGFDVLAVDEHLNCVPIQVKTSRSHTWITGDMSKYAEVTRPDRRIVLGEVRKARHPDLIRVYVSLGSAGEQDRFFILTEQEFFDAAVASFKAWLHRIGGVRPRNPKSMHSTINVSILLEHENAWHRVTDQLLALQSVGARSAE